MEGPVYREVLESSDIRSSVPGAEERGTINRIIFEELVNGRVLASSVRNCSKS